jgi:Putative protein-S-isoprenylcysteine methyltransferase
MKRWLKTIIILPFNALVVIPALALWASGFEPRLNSAPLAALGCALGIFGLLLAAWTMRLFATVGKGTAAPWDPPQKLVVRGPYCHVRNPMIASVLMMLMAEYLILGALAILAWLALFFAANMIYFPFFEERDLAKRFGADYAEYRRNVPRWIPRLGKWTPDK